MTFGLNTHLSLFKKILVIEHLTCINNFWEVNIFLLIVLRKCLIQNKYIIEYCEVTVGTVNRCQRGGGFRPQHESAFNRTSSKH